MMASIQGYPVLASLQAASNSSSSFHGIYNSTYVLSHGLVIERKPMQAEIKMKTADSISWFDFQIYKKIKESLSTSPHLKKKHPTVRKFQITKTTFIEGLLRAKFLIMLWHEPDIRDLQPFLKKKEPAPFKLQ
jgi:hypothetical protein